MTRKIHTFILIGLLIAFCYLFFIPTVWSIVTHGRTGITQGGKRFEIDCVIPWPNHHLYCYQGWWIRGEVVTHTLDDGTIITHTRPDLPGYCYVVQLNLEEKKP